MPLLRVFRSLYAPRILSGLKSLRRTPRRLPLKDAKHVETPIIMPKASAAGVYAVAKGFHPGVYSTWDDCEAQTKGFPGATHKKFKNPNDAAQWLATHGVAVEQPAASSSTAAKPARPSPIARPPPQGAGTKGRVKPGNGSLQGKDVIQDTTGWQLIYSDGACRGNGQVGAVAGVGVWHGPNDKRNIAERCPGSQTNNRAELIALVRILETVPKSKTGLLIKTDSTYSIKCIKEWLPKWKRNGWRTTGGKEVSNSGIIRYFDALLQERAKAGQKVHLEYVRGHAGDPGNEGADYQANRGCELPTAPERNWEELEKEVRHRMGSPELGAGYTIKQPTATSSVVEPTAASNGRAKAGSSIPIAQAAGLAPGANGGAASSSTLTHRAVAAQTLPWVHPQGLVPPNPSADQLSAEEIQAMADCLTDDPEADLLD